MTTSDGAHERRHAWVSAVEGGDVDAYAAIVTEDVVWFPPGGDPLRGRAAFRRWLEPFMGAFGYNLKLRPVTSQEGAGWAYEAGAFRSIMEPLEGGATQEHHGNYFVLWRHANDDVWRIERYVDLGEHAVVETRRR